MSYKATRLTRRAVLGPLSEKSGIKYIPCVSRDDLQRESIADRGAPHRVLISFRFSRRGRPKRTRGRMRSPESLGSGFHQLSVAEADRLPRLG